MNNDEQTATTGTVVVRTINERQGETQCSVQPDGGK